MASVRFGVDDYAPPDYVDFGNGGETGGKYLNPTTPPAPGSITAPGQPVATQPAPPSFPNLVGGTLTTNPNGSIGSVTRPGETTPTPWASLYSGSGGSTPPPSGDAFDANQVSAWWNSAYPGRNFDEGYWRGVWPSLLARGRDLNQPDYAMNRVLGMGAGPQDFALAGPFANGRGYSQPSAGSSASGAPGVNAFGYDDPSSLLFLNQALDRLRQLQQPVHDPFESLLQLVSLTRANDLSNPPYTSGEEAVLRAHYLEPLTQARDAALQRNTDAASRYGWLPSSGLLAHNNAQTEQGYERAVAGAANDTGLRAIDEHQRRLDEQLAILNALVNLSHSSFDRSEARSREALQTAEIFPNFDERRLSALLQASGEGASSPASVVSGLTGLGNLGLNASRLAYGQNQDSASMWGQILGYLLGQGRG